MALPGRCDGLERPSYRNDLLDPAAAQQPIALVANGGLTRGYAVTGLQKRNAKPARREKVDPGRGRAAPIADLDLARKCRFHAGEPIGVAGGQFLPGQLRMGSHHDPPGLGLQPHHVARLAEGDSQPLPLADGESLQPAVPPDHHAVGCHDFARAILGRPVLP